MLLKAWYIQNSDIGQASLATWTSPLINCGSARLQKTFDFLVIHNPIQTGVTAVVLLTIDPGSAVPKTYTKTFDLSKATTQTVTILGTNGAPILGYLAQVAVTLAGPGGGVPAPEIYGIELYDDPDSPAKMHAQ